MEAVSVRNLSKKYGDFQALTDVTLDVAEGELFALLGPNGAGKTTLMRILTTQLEPSSGSAHVLGRNVHTQGDEVRGLVSYVPQEMSVWTDISGYENLMIYSEIYGIPKAERKAAIGSALEMMDLAEFGDSLVSTYSGGMIRKLELASAIMIRPKILFLDEPTIGLDPGTRKTVWERLKALNRESGMNVFYTTHYMDEAGLYADMVGIISKGRLIKVASPDELKRSVGNEVISLELASPAGAAVLSRLRKMDGVVEVQADGAGLRMSVSNSSELLDPVIAALIEMKVGVRRVNATKPTIEDAFLKYAGAEALAESKQNVRDIRKTRERIRRGGA